MKGGKPGARSAAYQVGKNDRFPRGSWQLSAECGKCGGGWRAGHVDVVTEAAEVAAAKSGEPGVCDAVFMGEPGDRCRWRYTFFWLFVPGPKRRRRRG